jgi:hypothetical protein
MRIGTKAFVRLPHCVGEPLSMMLAGVALEGPCPALRSSRSKNKLCLRERPGTNVGTCVDGPKVTEAPSIPTALTQSEGAPPSFDAGGLSSRAPRPQTDFNRSLAVAVRAALTGGGREDGQVDFSPELDPLISHSMAKRELSAQADKGSEAQLVLELDSPRQTAAGAAHLSEGPATRILPPAGPVFSQPKNSLASGTECGPNLDSIATEAFAPSPGFRSAEASSEFLVRIENTIQAADNVMRLAQDVVHTAEPARQPEGMAASHHEHAFGLPARVPLAVALSLAIPLSAAMAWLIVVGPRFDTRTATSSLDRAAIISHPTNPLNERSIYAGEQDARIASASPDPEASAAVKQVAHAAVEAGSGPRSERVSEVASEERATLTIGGAVASVGGPEPLALPIRVGTDAPDGGTSPGPSGARDEEKAVGTSGRLMGIPSVLGTQHAAPATTEATSTAQASTPLEPTVIAPMPSGGAEMALQGPGRLPGGQAGQSPAGVAPQPTSRASSISADEIMRFRQRGEALVSAGDIAAGRLLLQRAAQAHDAQAALVLAGTYDPSVLAKLAAPGVAADPVAARRWYETAKALGSDLASQRLDILAEWLTLDHASPNPR